VNSARIGLAVALIWGIGACHGLKIADVEGSPETARGHQVLEAVERGDADAVMAQMSPGRQLPDTRESIRQIMAHLPPGPPSHLRLYGWYVHTLEEDTTITETAQLSFEATYETGTYYLFEMSFEGPQRALEMTGLQVTPLPAPLAVMNAFSFRGRSPRHFLFLVVMLASAATIVAALVRWKRTRRTLRHPWLWLIGILALPISPTLNWTTGQIVWSALKLQIGLCFSVGRAGEGGPWLLTCSLPIGAVFFLMRKRQQDPASVASGEGPPASVPEV
jgi:hypothetical protein